MDEIIRRLRRFSFEKLFRVVRTTLNKEKNIPGRERQETIDNFHKLFFQDRCDRFKWFGVDIIKYPTDLITYQEIIYETKPDLIIECGTNQGGSALFFAHLFDLIGRGEIVTIDIYNKNGPKHNRINYLNGKSTSREILEQVKSFLGKGKRVMVILDSDHDKNNVLKELKAYNKMVSEGCYLVVEDSNMNGHPVHKNFGAGPMEAIEEFMENNNDFEVDKTREKFLLTANPRGFLKKIKSKN